jgi:hypothetical protein
MKVTSIARVDEMRRRAMRFWNSTVASGTGRLHTAAEEKEKEVRLTNACKHTT